MKILYICTVDFSLTGIPVHIRNYYNVLSKKNHIDIVSPHFSKEILKTMPLHNNTKLYSLPRKHNPFRYLIELRKIAKENSYDVIHIHGNSSTMSLELFACKGLKSVLIVHTHNVDYKSKFLNKLFRNFMLNNADMYFAASKMAGDKLYKPKKYYVIENGILESNFKFNAKERLKIRRKLAIPEQTILLGNVGRFCEQKNQEFLIKIAMKLDSRKYHFLLIGDNSKEFKNQLKKSHLEKFFTILPATNNVGYYYSAFDMFLFPSKWEGLGMVAVEAQYSDVPCLISNKVPKEVEISNNTKFLPLKKVVWVNAIKDSSIIRKNTVYTDKYDIKKCADRVQKLYLIGIRNKK